ncbi:MAG TPA: heat-inducible transcription repressor HrcA [Gammaproteobacteria bacterium]|jgi:heat-inducible transcriptional repressor|nr:heat-inducible transcription repressor HrcA [Pseudomonadota bacterium]HAY46675.1 heat-inducible transcription repressor HrcA [Gammaproteobacteria bacterium]
MNLELDSRNTHLLNSLIRMYIEQGEPVGSRTLARHSQLELSPATIRNVMSDLEDLGLISAPHTSAGRIPTAMGYRVFVDSLLKVDSLGSPFKAVESSLSEDTDPSTLLARASTMLSEMTQFAGVVMLPGQTVSRLKQVEFVSLNDKRVLAILVTADGRVQNRVLLTEREYTPSELIEAANYFNDLHGGSTLAEVRKKLVLEMRSAGEKMHNMVQTATTMAAELLAEEENDGGDVVLSGQENLLNVPELCQIDKLQKLFNTLRAKQDLLDLLDRSMKVSGVSIFIGEESGYESLGDCSVITAPYESDGEVIGTLGVVGPTRMSYGQVISVVNVTSKLLSTALSTKSA